MSPAHRRTERRWPVLALVAVVLVGAAAASRTPRPSTPGGPPNGLSAMVSASDAESSAWYCTGQSTSSGQVDPGLLILTNSTNRAVSGSISSVTDSGATGQTDVVVPARGQLVPLIPPLSSGSWVSQVVILSGGGVAVTQAVSGPSGWSEAPCQSTTAARWYFPSGATSGSDDLFVTLLNPTSTADVVDLSFVTPTGTVHPINLQGLVLQPGQMLMENVAAVVQERSAVATTVATRTGRVVASEVETFTGGSAGLSIVPGSPRAERHWSIPQGIEQAGGSSEIDVFNPGAVSEEVTVRARLASGPLAPLEAKVLPGTTWVLATSTQTRIPAGVAYATDIEARGGSGVVVGRIVQAPGSAPAPQAGLANAIGALSGAVPSGQWVVPGPGTAVTPVITGAMPAHLALSNPSGATEHFTVSFRTPSGARTLATGRLAPGTTVTLDGATLSGAGLNPIFARSDGPLAVSEDVGPAASYGVVTMPAIPLAAALGI